MSAHKTVAIAVGRDHRTLIASGLLLDTDAVANDVMLPSQLYHRTYPESPSFGLCKAILIQAISDYLAVKAHPNCRRPTSCGHAAHHRDAVAYFQGQRRSTYMWCCGVLRLDPGALWARIQRLADNFPSVHRLHVHHHAGPPSRINGKRRQTREERPLRPKRQTPRSSGVTVLIPSPLTPVA